MKYLFIILLIANLSIVSNLGYAQDTAMHVSFKIKKDSCIATIDGVSEGEVIYAQPIATGKLEITGCEDCRIHGFDMKISLPGNKDSSKVITYHSSNSELTKEMLKALNKLDDKKVFQPRLIVFCNIIGRPLNSKTIVKLNDIILTTEPFEDPHWYQRVNKF